MSNETNLHWEILDKKRLELLPKLSVFKNRFYLAGGTALALYLGHRDSIDFDFFIPNKFDHQSLIREIKKTFEKSEVKEIINQPNTVLLEIDGISASFFFYEYPLLEPLLQTEYLNIASLADIGCMKLEAILGRYRLKDYVDLYAICKTMPLKGLLEKAKDKFPIYNLGAFVRALGYYEDIEMDKIIFKNDFYVGVKTIEEFFKNEIKKLFNL